MQEHSLLLLLLALLVVGSIGDVSEGHHVQDLLCQYCARENIQVVAYSSLGCGNLLDGALVQQGSEATGLSPGQSLLVWALKRGLCVIPKSVHPQRIAEFSPAALLGPAAMSSDVSLLDQCTEAPKLCWDPSSVTA